MYIYIYISTLVKVIFYYASTLLFCIGTVLSESLSLCYDKSLGCRWRMEFNMEGSSEYIEKADADS